MICSLIKKALCLALVLTIFGLFLPGITCGQGTPLLAEKETELRHFADSINQGSTHEVRENSLEKFNELMGELLKLNSTFDYPFDSVKTLSKLASSDKRVKVYTWVAPSMKDKQYHFYGMMQVRDPKDGTVKVLKLKDGVVKGQLYQDRELGPDEWFGAVYYDVVTIRKKKQTRYYLLGWRGNDQFTTSKVIDLMKLKEDETPVFGEPVFRDSTGTDRYRMVFTYASDAVMLLRYNSKKKMFIFDHLSPADPAASGDFRFYGPDFTYDGLRSRKGRWEYVKNLDLKNKTR